MLSAEGTQACFFRGSDAAPHAHAWCVITERCHALRGPRVGPSYGPLRVRADVSSPESPCGMMEAESLHGDGCADCMCLPRHSRQPTTARSDSAIPTRCGAGSECIRSRRIRKGRGLPLALTDARHSRTEECGGGCVTVCAGERVEWPQRGRGANYLRGWRTEGRGLCLI